MQTIILIYPYPGSWYHNQQKHVASIICLSSWYLIGYLTQCPDGGQGPGWSSDIISYVRVLMLGGF